MIKTIVRSAAAGAASFTVTERGTKNMRYTYSYGYRTHEAALDALHDMCASGELTMGEGPEINSYRTNTRELRWRITLPDNNLWHVA